MESTVDTYPLHQSRHSGNYTLPGPMSLLPSSGGAIGGHTLTHPPIPISELAVHIDKLKLNNNALFCQVVDRRIHSVFRTCMQLAVK